MITKFSKWILFVSSYIPLYLVFIVSNIFDIHTNYNKLKMLKSYDLNMFINSSKRNIVLVIIFVSLIILSVIFIKIMFWKKSKSSNFIEIVDIESNNKSINEYVLVYILPFISIQSNNYKELIIFLIVFITIGIISVKNDLVYINPLLYFFKYNMYSFKEKSNNSSNILISKYTILELKELGILKEESINIRLSKISTNVYYI